MIVCGLGKTMIGIWNFYQINLLEDTDDLQFGKPSM